MPIHESKISYFENDNLVSEVDDFFYNVTDTLAYRLILSYEFKKSAWNCEFVVVEKIKKGPAKFWPITLAHADSVLTKWGLSR